jgi:hypothetical protein
MSLLKLIDKNAIERVIEYSQDIENPKIDVLLERWASMKAGISNRFLNKGVSYTHPKKVRFELNDQAKGERLDNFIGYIDNLFSNGFCPLVNFLSHISIAEFYNNCLEKEFIIDSREGKKISAGTKVVKSFKYFIEDPKLLSDLQNKASELIQENKVEGYLTFSIHPLDFLSSSENTYNWRSCHALDGEYRAGNLSYMCDIGTMIVYLSSDKEEKLPHFPSDVKWNSKKWRMLIHFSNDLNVCFAGRQYPFNSPGALNIVNDVFSERLCPSGVHYSWGSNREVWSPWYNDYLSNYKRNDESEVSFEDDKYFIVNDGIFNKCDCVRDAARSRHFNDITRSSCYHQPWYMFKKMWTAQDKIEFTIGAEIACLKCGERTIEGQDSMMCPTCECTYGTSESDEYRYCDCCGARFWTREAYYVGDEDMICPSCEARETFICEECGGRFYNSEMHWSNSISGYICNFCNNERNGEEE